jgi:hypothetical protein
MQDKIAQAVGLKTLINKDFWIRVACFGLRGAGYVLRVADASIAECRFRPALVRLYRLK